jgi:hypothetical protein
MSKGIFVVLLVLCALLAIASARPIMFLAEELDTNLVNITNGWSGIAMAWVTLSKGNSNHRVRVFGNDNINDTLTNAWLTFANGTIVANLKISTNKADHYIVGDLRINATIWSYLNQEKLVVIVASSKFPKGAIGGLLQCRPSMAVAFLTGGAVVGTASNSTTIGLAFSWIYSTAFATGLPQDLIQQDNAVVAGLRFKSRAIYNATGVTSATFNAPANTTSVAPALVNLTNGADVSFVAAFTPVTTTFFAANQYQAYVQVNTAVRPNGDVRGQLIPTLGLTRRAIPYSVQSVTGSFSAPNGLETLRHPNMQGVQKNFGSFVSCVAQQTTPGTNFTFEALFKFPASTTRRNFNLVRGLSIELNLRLFGSGTWSFDWFDSETGGNVNAATFSTPGNWTAGFADYFAVDASTFANNRRQLVVRVTFNAATSSTLWIDLFGIRAYQPDALSNQILKPFAQIIDILPAH